MSQICTSYETLLPPSTATSDVAAGMQDQADSSGGATSFLQSLSANTNSNGASFGNTNSPSAASMATPANPPAAGSTSSSPSSTAPSTQNGNSSAASPTSNGQSAAPTNRGKRSQSSQNDAAQNSPTQNQSPTSSSVSSSASPTAANGKTDASAQADAAQLQAADAAAAQNAAAANGSQAASSSTGSTTPAALAQILQAGTDSAAKSKGSPSAADTNQPVVPPTGLVDVLAKASRDLQDSAAAKSTASDQPGSGTGTQSNKSADTATNATATNAAAALNVTGAETAAGVQTAAAAGPRVQPQRNGSSSASGSLAGGLNVTGVDAIDASADQVSALQSAALEGQLSAAVADPTAAGVPSEASSTDAQRSTAGSPLGKSSDKSNGADSTASGSNRAESAGLTVSSPASTGPGAGSTSVAHATGGPSAQSMQSAQEMADRVADALRTGFDSGGELRVRLEPPSLGKVQIEVQSDAGAVSARLEVQTPAARQTLLDNISMLHDAIGQTGATVGRIDIEVVPQQHQDSTGSDPRNSHSGGQQQDSGSSSQDQSNTRGGTQQQNSNRWRTAAINELDIDI